VIYQLARFEIFTVVEIPAEIFWVVTCSVVVGHQRFGGPLWLNLQCGMKMEAARTY